MSEERRRYHHIFDARRGHPSRIGNVIKRYSHVKEGPLPHLLPVFTSRLKSSPHYVLATHRWPKSRCMLATERLSQCALMTSSNIASLRSSSNFAQVPPK